MENTPEDLIKKYLAGECTEEEKSKIESWYLSQAKSNRDLPKHRDLEQIESEIWNSIHRPKSTIGAYRRWLSVAAAALIVTGISWLFLKPDAEPSATAYTAKQQVEITTGGKKATLVLANGKKVILDSIIESSNASGTIALENLLDRFSPAKETDLAVTYHKIEVPKGGEFQFTLPDGTKVWLNSESSFSFPSRFTGGERKVGLSGEGYFEVAKNPDLPFKVTANQAEITVLGTHFNISAYQDEANTEVTLAEGSVKVSSNENAVILKPDQTAKLAKGSDGIKVSSANTNEILAWKDGFFVFDNSDIKTIMKTLSRWYDFEMVYNTSPTTKKFGGTFSKSKEIKDLLASLELLGAGKFEIQGRRIVLMP